MTAATALHLAVGWALWSLAAYGTPLPARTDDTTAGLIHVRLVKMDTDAPRQREDPKSAAARQGAVAPRPQPGPTAVAQARLDGTSPSVRPLAAPLSAVPDASVRAPDLPSAEVLAYRALLEAHLARYRVYPASAQAAGRQGVVVLHFVTDRFGRVIDAWIDTSSGVSTIDQEALEAVARAQPLPPFPSDWPGKVDFSLPVTFKLG